MDTTSKYSASKLNNPDLNIAIQDAANNLDAELIRYCFYWYG